MKLQERLPEGVTVKGKFIRMDFDFRNVLRMLDELARDDLMPEAKIFRALRCLMKHPPMDAAPVMEAVKGLLFPETKQNAKKDKITDFEQDADLIRAAFLQSYGINLWRDRLSWFEFSSLLACMPEGSRYAEILGIRTRPMPPATKWNAEERRWLAEAKARYSVHMTDKERAQQMADGLRSVAISLLTLAEGGGAHE